MIDHQLVDIAQKASRYDTYRTKRNAGQINILIALRIRYPARTYDNRPRRIIARDTGDYFQFVEQGGAGEDDGRLDDLGVRDAEFELHDAADIVDGVGDELGDEDVVVSRIANGSADDTDGEGERCDGGD